jgi:hypothetical protein
MIYLLLLLLPLLRCCCRRVWRDEPERFEIEGRYPVLDAFRQARRAWKGEQRCSTPLAVTSSGSVGCTPDGCSTASRGLCCCASATRRVVVAESCCAEYGVTGEWLSAARSRLDADASTNKGSTSVDTACVHAARSRVSHISQVTTAAADLYTCCPAVAAAVPDMHTLGDRSAAGPWWQPPLLNTMAARTTAFFLECAAPTHCCCCY